MDTRLAVLLVTSRFLFAQDASVLQRFEYDSHAPLDIQATRIERRHGVAIHDISYASPKGGRVPAYLVVPKGKGPFAAVI